MKFMTLIFVNCILQCTGTTSESLSWYEVHRDLSFMSSDYNWFDHDNKTNDEFLFKDSYLGENQLHTELGVKEELYNSQMFEVALTAYTDDPKEGSGTGLTASGTKPIVGRTVAVSRDLFASLKGKSIYIEGYGTYIVEDTMHSKYKKKVDLFVKTKKEAFNKIGHQKGIKIYVLE